MFAHPTPQSRDRMYVVFWKKGNRAPNLDICPLAWCERCGVDVGGVQTWKRGDRRFGRYGAHGQYIYTCPECRTQVHPYYYPALTAIDWSLPIQRIGDRQKPLKEKTLARIKLGLDRFKNQHLVMDILYSHAHSNMSRPITDPMQTQTAQQSLALIRMPWLFPINQSGERARAGTDPLPTQTASLEHGLVAPDPFMVEMHGTSWARPITDAMGAVLASTVHHYLAVPKPYLVKLCQNSDVIDIEDPLHTQVASGSQHGLVMPFLVRNYESAGDLSKPVTEPTGTITAVDHHSLVMPFLASYYGTENVRPVTDPEATVTGTDRHSLVMPQPFIASQYNGPHRNAVSSVNEAAPTVPGMAVHYLTQPDEEFTVEDCGFRMLEPHEIRAAMAFPGDYTVLGTKRERVKQLGNAVTPPVMELLLKRCLETLN
jgi:DNA (cytosine-5)-methyltransferase 1